MAVTVGPRSGVTLWSAVDGSDPVTRAQFQASHTSIEALMALDVQQALPLPAAGTRGRYLWITDDRGGRLYRDSGAALFDLGPKPIDGPAAGYTARITGHASAAVGDDVLQLRGKTAQTGDLFRVTDPTGGTTWQHVTAAGELISQGASTASVYGARTTGDTVDRLAVRGDALLSFSSGSAAADLFLSRNSAGRLNLDGTLQVQNLATGGAPLSFVTLALQAAAGQTGVLLAGRDSSAFNRFTVGTDGDLRIIDADGTTRLIELQASSGGVFATGTSSYFGPFAMGGTATGTRTRLLMSATTIGVIAESDAATPNVDILYRIKGTGVHRFQNDAAANKLTIDNTGTISAAGNDHYFGNNAIGAGAGARLHIATDVSGAYARLKAEGSVADVGLVYNTKGAGTHVWQNDASTIAQLSAAGSLYAIGADHYFGPNALGATGSRVRLHGDSTAYAAVYAEGSAASVDLYAAAKGTAGNLFLQTNNISRLIVWNDGTIFAGNGAGGTGKRTRLAWDATFSYIDGDDQAGSTVNGNMYLRSGSIYMQIANSAGEIRIFNQAGAWIGGMNVGGGFNGASTTHTFGPNAVGSAGSALRINAADLNNVYLSPVSSSIGAHLHLRPLGANNLYLEDGSGNMALEVVQRGGASGSTQLQISYNNAGVWESHNVAVNTAVSPRTLIVT